MANSFVIREIDPASPNFLYSANIFDVAERNGLWSKSSGKKLDFLPTYAPLRSHSEYSTRRVWRVFDIVAPSLHLSGETTPYGDTYPFSVKAERLLGPEDLMAMFRDHYEGTIYHLFYVFRQCAFSLWTLITRREIAVLDSSVFALYALVTVFLTY